MSLVSIKELEHKTPYQLFHEGWQKYTQITGPYSEEANKRCAIGVVLSEQGWDGRAHFDYCRNDLQAVRQLSELMLYNDIKKMSFEEIDKTVLREI